jgi:AAA15 family ATPase/GTPase
MLLGFKSANYKSFKDELVFSLVPAPKQKGLDYSVMKTQAGKKEYKGLCSAVVYGPNASGKTNIIGAMDAFKSIVLRGNIRNDTDDSEPNAAAGTLELIPNKSLDTPLPIEFSITFVEEGLHIEYAFSADLGEFLTTEHKRKILSETLKINNNLIFTRDKGLDFGSLDIIQNYFVNAFEQNADGAISLAKSNLNSEELFLMNGFKTMFSSKLVALIADWLDKKFIVIYRANSMRLIRNSRLFWL